MQIQVRLGANNDGRIRALEVTTLSNSGAYGEHGWATVGLTGHKSIPLYTASLEAFKFTANVVYTNMQPSGAYRGFGATQGQFAVETTVNELAEKLGATLLSCANRTWCAKAWRCPRTSAKSPTRARSTAA